MTTTMEAADDAITVTYTVVQEWVERTRTRTTMTTTKEEYKDREEGGGGKGDNCSACPHHLHNDNGSMSFGVSSIMPLSKICLPYPGV